MTLAVDELTAQLAAVIDGFVWRTGHNAPVITALAIQGHPRIAQALADSALLDRLRQAHRPRPWGPDSTSSTCTCGLGRCPVLDEVLRC